jgi:hypothetical protein
MSSKCHTPESPVLWAFLKFKMPKKAVFCYAPCLGEYVIISTQAGGACYSKGFKASHKPKTMEKMRCA